MLWRAPPDTYAESVYKTKQFIERMLMRAGCDPVNATQCVNEIELHAKILPDRITAKEKDPLRQALRTLTDDELSGMHDALEMRRTLKRLEDTTEIQRGITDVEERLLAVMLAAHCENLSEGCYKNWQSYIRRAEIRQRRQNQSNPDMY